MKRKKKDFNSSSIVIIVYDKEQIHRSSIMFLRLDWLLYDTPKWRHSKSSVHKQEHVIHGIKWLRVSSGNSSDCGKHADRNEIGAYIDACSGWTSSCP